MILLSVALTPTGLTAHALPRCVFKRVGRLCEAIDQNSTPTSLRQVIGGDGRSCIQDDSVIRYLNPLHAANYTYAFQQICVRFLSQSASDFKSLEWRVGMQTKNNSNAVLVCVLSAYIRVQIIA